MGIYSRQAHAEFKNERRAPPPDLVKTHKRGGKKPFAIEMNNIFRFRGDEPEWFVCRRYATLEQAEQGLADLNKHRHSDRIKYRLKND